MAPPRAEPPFTMNSRVPCPPPKAAVRRRSHKRADIRSPARENNTGNAVTAAVQGCTGCGYHTRPAAPCMENFPGGKLERDRPPPAFGSRVLSGLNRTSEFATYTWSWSAAEPHMIPPSAPPLPTRVCQRILPCWSGSSAWTTPDFCPKQTRCPLRKLTRIGD